MLRKKLAKDLQPTKPTATVSKPDPKPKNPANNPFQGGNHSGMKIDV